MAIPLKGTKLIKVFFTFLLNVSIIGYSLRRGGGTLCKKTFSKTSSKGMEMRDVCFLLPYPTGNVWGLYKKEAMWWSLYVNEM